MTFDEDYEIIKNKVSGSGVFELFLLETEGGNVSTKYPAIRYSKHEISFIDDEYVTEVEISSGTAIRNGKTFTVTIQNHEKNGVCKSYAFIHNGGSEDDFKYLVDDLNPYSLDGTIF